MEETYYFESADDLCEYMSVYKYETNEYIYDKICNALKENYDEVPLFYYQKNNEVLEIKITITNQGVINPLKICLQRFSEIENYEKCSECLKLIQSLS